MRILTSAFSARYHTSNVPPPEPLEVLSVPDDSPPEIQPSSPERTLHRFFKWLHPALPTFPPRVRLHFFQRQMQHDEGVELRERPPSVVDVPLATANLVRFPFFNAHQTFDCHTAECFKVGHNKQEEERGGGEEEEGGRGEEEEENDGGRSGGG